MLTRTEMQELVSQLRAGSRVKALAPMPFGRSPLVRRSQGMRGPCLTEPCPPVRRDPWTGPEGADMRSHLQPPLAARDCHCHMSGPLRTVSGQAGQCFASA